MKISRQIIGFMPTLRMLVFFVYGVSIPPVQHIPVIKRLYNYRVFLSAMPLKEQSNTKWNKAKFFVQKLAC